MTPPIPTIKSIDLLTQPCTQGGLWHQRYCIHVQEQLLFPQLHWAGVNVGNSAGFLWIPGHGVQRCIALHQAQHVLEVVVRLRDFSHLNTSTLSFTSQVTLLSSVVPPAVSLGPCRLGDTGGVDRCQIPPSTSNCNLGSKCLSTAALELWATCLYVTRTPTPQSGEMSSMCFSCLLLEGIKTLQWTQSHPDLCLHGSTKEIGSPDAALKWERCWKLIERS